MKQIEASAPRGVFVARLGAEAKVDLVDWRGKVVIRKARLPKNYRNSDLDQLLRAKRTRQEVELLHRARLAGVNCPVVFFADPERAEIFMERISGDLLTDIEASAAKESARLESIYETLGTLAARLHKAKIIHGDLTTKNVVAVSDKVYLLDFGLSFISERIEDRAEDLHLLKQALRSALSSNRASSVFEVVAKSYAKECGVATYKRVLNQLREIERRGRYARVD